MVSRRDKYAAIVQHPEFVEIKKRKITKKNVVKPNFKIEKISGKEDSSHNEIKTWNFRSSSLISGMQSPCVADF
jgi:hypothetical protein